VNYIRTSLPLLLLLSILIPENSATVSFSSKLVFPVAEFFITGERFVVITRQLQAAEVFSKLSTMNDKSSFV
jgi:hypothetical protein